MFALWDVSGREFGKIQREFLPHRPVAHVRSQCPACAAHAHVDSSIFCLLLPRQVVAFYYTRWKYSPQYRQWKRVAAREKQRLLAKQTAYFHAERQDIRNASGNAVEQFEDHNESFCSVCHEGGSLVCCEGLCNRAFHVKVRRDTHSRLLPTSHAGA